MTEGWLNVCALAELRPAEPKGLNVEGLEIVLVLSKGVVYALQGLCTHDHARLCEGRVTEGALLCPRHGAAFSLEDGAAKAGFRLPALKRYETRVVGEQVLLNRAELSVPVKQRWDLTRKGG